MAKSVKNTAVARQVEFIIRRLNSLSTLPEVAAGFLSNLADGKSDITILSEIIESDPALSAKVFSLAYKEGITFADDRPTVAEAVAKLPEAKIRNAVLSVKVFQAFEADYDPDSKRLLPRKQLALHALATACCARRIAALLLDSRGAELAFSAGLLHDIGKLAIDEVMPKSFERIVQEAQAEGVCILDVEQRHLGLDHTIIGKRLAQKWGLPEEITFAIWLHHSDTEAISVNMPEAGLAGIVRLACIIARQCGIGMSGSFDSPGPISHIIQSLSLSQEQIERIRGKLAEEVSEKSELLGLTVSGGPAAYCDIVHQTAAELSEDNGTLLTENRRLTTQSAQMELINEFLLNVSSDMSPIDVAAVFAAGWRKHYQTGPVCAFLQNSPNEPFLEMVTVDESGRADTVLLNVPADRRAIPQQLLNKFDILQGADCMDWLFEQADCQIDVSKTKVAPLISRGKAVGAIVFEQRLPTEPTEWLSVYNVSASIAANVISLAFASQQQGRLAERFAQLLGRLKQSRQKLADAKSLAGIAEMAAGAAHELNNPLAVMSGRVQLLYDSEDDNNKKQILKQIQQRTNEISQIVGDLMEFARPKQPVPTVANLRGLIDKAVADTAGNYNLEQIEVEFQAIDESGDVYVDGEQIVSVIVNILSNALESYNSGSGPVKIDGGCPQSGEFVTFKIIDSGCGMDPQTLQKAAEPFFSVRPAGRKRGMGLAAAARLIQLNNGSIHLASEPDKGTTVTIKLPRC